MLMASVGGGSPDDDVVTAWPNSAEGPLDPPGLCTHLSVLPVGLSALLKP